MNLKAIFSDKLYPILSEDLTKEQTEALIETPKQSSMGDLSFPCFILAKKMKQSPAAIAEKIAAQLSDPLFEKVEAAGPYVNIFFSKSQVGSEIINNVLFQKETYGNSTEGTDKTVVVDLSSPNIAKPFSMGHLRSTVIGNALANIAEKCGYQSVRINHLGDWGTQFGKLITAYKKWGDAKKVQENPIQELFKLYTKFHEEANEELDAEARYWFKELENGNEEAKELWQWFREESLKEFMEIYELLDIKFDSFNGEAFYNDKMDAAIELLAEKNLLVSSEGAEVVQLEDKDLPPCLIRKSDGATLYATRDLAAAVYRQNTYHFSKAFYVVGHEQSIHFQQLFAVLKKAGLDWSDEMKHVPFGLYLKDGKKMSTRKGRVILLEEVLREAIDLATTNIITKNPNLQNVKETAESIGVGAVIFHDLKNDRMNNIEFSLKDMLTFEGETGPYLQYSNARAHTILKKAGVSEEELQVSADLTDAESWEVAKQLNLYESKIKAAFKEAAPSIIAKYLLDLAKAFNRYYGNVRILEDSPGKASRLALVKAVTVVLTDGLHLIGMKAPKEM